MQDKSSSRTEIMRQTTTASGRTTFSGHLDPNNAGSPALLFTSTLSMGSAEPLSCSPRYMTKSLSSSSATKTLDTQLSCTKPPTWRSRLLSPSRGYLTLAQQLHEKKCPSVAQQLKVAGWCSPLAWCPGATAGPQCSPFCTATVFDLG